MPSVQPVKGGGAAVKETSLSLAVSLSASDCREQKSPCTHKVLRTETRNCYKYVAWADVRVPEGRHQCARAAERRFTCLWSFFAWVASCEIHLLLVSGAWICLASNIRFALAHTEKDPLHEMDRYSELVSLLSFKLAPSPP